MFHDISVYITVLRKIYMLDTPIWMKNISMIFIFITDTDICFFYLVFHFSVLLCSNLWFMDKSWMVSSDNIPVISLEENVIKIIWINHDYIQKNIICCISWCFITVSCLFLSLLLYSFCVATCKLFLYNNPSVSFIYYRHSRECPQFYFQKAVKH